MCDFFSKENKFLELHKRMQKAALEKQLEFEEEVKPDIIVESKDEVAVFNSGSQCKHTYSR